MFFDYITASHLIIMDGLLVQLVLDTLWQLENYSYDVTWSVGPNNNIIFINAEKLQQLQQQQLQRKVTTVIQRSRQTAGAVNLIYRILCLFLKTGLQAQWRAVDFCRVFLFCYNQRTECSVFVSCI